MSTDLLREAEADLAELVGLPVAIRDKVKAGVAELRRLHDAVEAELARLTGGAKATLDALRGLRPEPAKIETGRPEGDTLPPAFPGEDGKPPLTV